MSSSLDPGRPTDYSSDTIPQAPKTPQLLKDFSSDIPLCPVRRNPSGDSVGSVTHNLPNLSYSKSTSRNNVSDEISTEYNPPMRGSASVPRPNRVRSHYLSLDHAIADNSQPEFKPERLYADQGDNSSDSSLEDKDRGPNNHSRNVSEGQGYAYDSYPPKPNYTSGKISATETDFLKTPTPSLFPRGLPKPPKRHPFLQGYEAPEWRTFAIHTLFCLLAYPFILIFVVIARGRTLFWTRLLVGAGYGIAGLSLSMSLLMLARRHLEAAAWATVIHQSKSHDRPGIRLKDIAPHAENPVSAYNGLMLLWNRHMYRGTARKNRAHYDARPWSIHIIFFLILFGIAGVLPFIFGRIVDIDTRIENQHKNYYETSIKGDISDADVERAKNLTSWFDDWRLTWTLAPYSSHGGLPPVIDLPWTTTNQTDQVYFSETTKSQLLPDGKGFGTFEPDVLTPSLDPQESSASVSTLGNQLSPGNVVRQPRWGIRIKCAKIPDAENNILPISKNLSRTYVFIPKETVGSLLDYYQKPLPTNFTPPTMAVGDQDWPSNVDQSKILRAVDFYSNGVNHAYWSQPLYGMGEDDTGFVSLEIVLIRLNTTFAPQGNFPLRGDVVPDINGTATYIGYDAAVCIELFEPWVVEVYNSTVGNPTTLRIIEKGNVVRDFNTGDVREKRMGKAVDDANVRRELTSRRIQAVYEAAHQNSLNQMIKDNGRDSWYVPSPIAISYTTGQGAFGYTSLSSEHYQNARALGDASNMLPYFAGSGSIVARVYPDRVLAYAYINPVQMVIALVVVFGLGLAAALFVPRLPMGVPRRGFELYSWVAAFYADELVGVGRGDVPGVSARGFGDGGNGGGATGVEGGPGQVGLPIGRRMEVAEIEQHIGDVRFRYVP